MWHWLAAEDVVKEVSSGYTALIKTGIILLIGLAAFVWWLRRQT